MPLLQRAAEPFHDLVEESFDEAAFLWRRWEGELTSLTRNLDEIWSWTEDRLHGALDGVRAAGTAAIDVATAGLLSDDIHRIAAATTVLASSAEQGATDAIAAALSVAEGEKLSAMIRGLELHASNQALRAAASVLLARGPAYAGALCRLKAFRRIAPGTETVTAFNSNVPTVQVDAVRAALQMPSLKADEWIAAALRSGDAAVSFAALESGIGLGSEQAWEVITRLARQRNGDVGPYLKLLALLGTAREHEIVYAALRSPESQLHAIWALGHIGTVRAVESCLAGMQHEDLARASGEAYCWITGADLDRDRLAVKETLPEVPAFEDDDLEANLVPPPEALWPLPDLEATQQHWLVRRPGFVPDVRYIHGRPATIQTLSAMVETGPMLRRPDLVLELRAKSRGKYDVAPRAFAPRQRQMMATGRTALSGHGGR